MEALDASDPEDASEEASFHQVGCMEGTLLLLGFAVENAFKAVIVAQVPPTLRKNGRIDRHKLGGGASGHDLLALAKQIDLKLSNDEKKVLERLTAHTEWLGKYKVPLSESAYKDS